LENAGSHLDVRPHPRVLAALSACSGVGVGTVVSPAIGPPVANLTGSRVLGRVNATVLSACIAGILLARGASAVVADGHLRACLVAAGRVRLLWRTHSELRAAALHQAGIGRTLEEHVEILRQTVPVGRVGGPYDIARAVAFFTDEDAGFNTGQTLYVSGGPHG
jgi:hypothetical protein